MQISKRSLVALRKRAGSFRVLGAAIGVHRSTVARWASHGIPKKGKGRKALTDFFSLYKEGELSSEFQELLKAGDKTDKKNQRRKPEHRDPFELPKSEGVEDKTTRETVTSKRTKLWNRKLSQKVILEALWWFEKTNIKQRRFWQMGYEASSYAPYGRPGNVKYPLWEPQVMKAKAAKNLTLLYVIPTTRVESRRKALGEIATLLDQDFNALPPHEVFLRRTFVHSWDYHEGKAPKQKKRKVAKKASKKRSKKPAKKANKRGRRR